MQFENFREDVRRWGLTKSLYLRVMRRLEKYLGFRLFVIHSRPLDPNAPQDVIPDDCSARVLEEQELVQFSRNPDLGLSEDFVAKASARGDVCFGYLERGSLVSYVWVGSKPTPAEVGLWVQFGEGHSYGYKALTLPSHRGRHLQECLTHLSDRWLTSHGYRYNIDYIHTLNLPSIVADRRYGNRPIGYAGYVRWFGRTLAFRTPGVKARGFRFFIPTVDQNR
jgi:hypothetical protein